MEFRDVKSAMDFYFRMEVGEYDLGLRSSRYEPSYTVSSDFDYLEDLHITYLDMKKALSCLNRKEINLLRLITWFPNDQAREYVRQKWRYLVKAKGHKVIGQFMNEIIDKAGAALCKIDYLKDNVWDKKGVNFVAIQA